MYVDVEAAAASTLTIGDRVTITNLEFLGKITFPDGFEFEGTEVGGLSGLIRNPSSGLYYALSDDLTDARFCTLQVELVQIG